MTGPTYSGLTWQWTLVSSVTFVTVLLPTKPVFAQSVVIPDETLGDEASLIREVDGLTQHIEGGALRGGNLFHSFLEFNVAAGNSVYFANPLDVTSILTRVTGENPSNILGQLGVLGEADLFLLNPNGIVFGENASLDVAGSFHAIAAPAIPLGEGVFSAVEPESSSLLSVSPEASLFNYLGNGTGDVTNEGALAVGDGQSLTLLGDTTLSSGELTAAGGTVRVLGNRVGLIEQATVDVSAADGSGTVLIGGEFQGQEGLPTAERTYVGPEVTIMADAHGLGDGGRVIVWADEATQFAGDISARGGEAGGDGGFVEVSGLESLSFTGMVDTQAVQGEAGELLLDPAQILISDLNFPGFVAVDSESAVFKDFVYGELEDIGQKSTIAPAVVEELLKISDLTLEATDVISVLSNVNASSKNDLTLKAGRINVSGVRLGQSGGGDIVLESTPDPNDRLIEGVFVFGGGRIDTDVDSGTTVNGGDININTQILELTETFFTRKGGTISASTNGNGNSGKVTVVASDYIVVAGQSSLTSQVGGEGKGNSGGITIATPSLKVLDNAQVGATTFGEGNSGLVEVVSSGNILVEDSSFLSNQVGEGATGSSSGVSITTINLTVRDKAQVDANTSGKGNSGLVEVTASGNILVEGSALLSSQVGEEATGSSSGVSITTANLTVRDNAQIDANTFGKGDLGSVDIVASGNILVDRGGFIGNRVGEEATGSSSGVSITTTNLTVRDKAQVGANTFGQGNSGLVEIVASGDVLVDGDATIGSQVGEKATGNSGGISITTTNLSVRDKASVSANASGQGNSGLVKVIASGNILIDQKAFLGSQVGEEATGNSGGISITTTNLLVLDNAQVGATTFGQGNSGLVNVVASGDVVVARGALLSSGVSENAKGDSGDVSIITTNLIVRDQAGVGAPTFGQGNSGLVNVAASGDVVVERGSLLSSRVSENAKGDSGGVSITTTNLAVRDQAGVEANTFSEGSSGLVDIVALGDVFVEDGAFVSSFVAEGARGNSGGVSLATTNLSVLNGAEVTARTDGDGTAGSVLIRSNKDNNLMIFLTEGSAITATTSSQASGGNLEIASASEVTIKGSGELTVESLGPNSGDAGNLNVSANSVLLDDRVELSAQSASTEGGGNVNFEVDEVLQLRNGSFINAESTNPDAGDGGNVNINAEFVVAFPDENSDIIANAVGGNGGRININATGVYGLSENSGNTSDIRANGTSDISASSELGQQGTVALNTLVTDPTQGQAALADTFVNPDDLISTSCIARDTQAVGSFTIPGAGGLPTTPDDSTTSTYSTGTVEPLTTPTPAEPDDMSWQPGDPIVEPEAATQLADGRIVIARYCDGDAVSAVGE